MKLPLEGHNNIKVQRREKQDGIFLVKENIFVFNYKI